MRIAVVTMGVKLPGETRGYTRFRRISEMLCAAGFQVDLITTTFQHWEKRQRQDGPERWADEPYRVRFISEPGYERNIDLKRIASHRAAAKDLARLFAESGQEYSLIYAEIPPNDVARACAEYATERGIPFVADVNDLWPEAMRMALNIPVVSDLAFRPFARDARIVYQALSAAVGTSDEYAERPERDRSEPYRRETVYVGGDLAAFDAGVAEFGPGIRKPADQIWVAYAGTLGESYDLETLIRALASLADARLDEELIGHERGAAKRVRGIILGDGPKRAALEQLARELDAPVEFAGYLDYPQMAAWLSASDIVVNSLVPGAVQSIVTKIGDYLASRSALINTGTSPEFCAKVERQRFGMNVEPGNPEALAYAIRKLATDERERMLMGLRGREVAETEFDQAVSYQRIVALVEELLGADGATDYENR